MSSTEATVEIFVRHHLTAWPLKLLDLVLANSTRWYAATWSRD